MNRRSFIQLSYILIPVSTVSYSFAGGWAHDWLDDVQNGMSKYIPRPIRGTDYTFHFDKAEFYTPRFIKNGVESIRVAFMADRVFRGRDTDVHLARDICKFVRKYG